mmetsp:Transcript_28876/g.83028  ORF Transcript_28876/g.83028 Transcript_28876/m.83028 type:complete len:329 (-) Transcript_28876:262-1248(-)
MPLPVLHQVLQSDLAFGVCSYFDCHGLSSAELAGCDRCAVAACWRTLRTAAEDDFAWWFPQRCLTLPEPPKEALRELRIRQRSVASVPEKWAPYICQFSAECVHIAPRTPPSAAAGAHHGGVEDYVGLDVEREPIRQALVPPRLAAVPMALGSHPEAGLAAGVRLSCRRASHVGEGCLVAAEYAGVLDGEGVITTVSFAPVSGRCFVCFEGEPYGLTAQPLPPLADPAAADPEWVDVEAFLLASPSGGVSFGRRFGAEAPVEWSGELPREFLPDWATELFASLNFQVDRLEEPAQVSIEWVGFELPAQLAACVAPLSQFTAVWSSHMW